jgi:predicted flap endonuclease-1-like 5' DNA nuclease
MVIAMSYKITDIEGIGPVYAEKLAAAKISTTDDLLTCCATPAGRKAVADATGLSTAVLLKWANRADLMRISGVGSQFSELLEMAGVDTVKELRTRNAENLASAIADVNEKKKLARTSPAAAAVAGWIEQAKKMEPRISH